MTSHRSLRSTVGGLLAVVLFAGAAQATTQVSPLPAVSGEYGPMSTPLGGGVPWAPPIGSTATDRDARIASLCSSALMEPGRYRPGVVAECEQGVAP